MYAHTIKQSKPLTLQATRSLVERAFGVPLRPLSLLEVGLAPRINATRKKGKERLERFFGLCDTEFMHVFLHTLAVKELMHGLPRLEAFNKGEHKLNPTLRALAICSARLLPNLDGSLLCERCEIYGIIAWGTMCILTY